MINIEEFLDQRGCSSDDVSLDDFKAFAIEILKYNLKQYRTQLQQFNTGDATKFKSFDEITLETIKELENEKDI